MDPLDQVTNNDSMEKGGRVVTIDHSAQTSLQPTPISSAYPSSTSDISAKSDFSSDCLSVTKLDALLTNSMKIMVKRSSSMTGPGSVEYNRRLSVLSQMRRPADRGAFCQQECFAGHQEISETNQSPNPPGSALSNLHRRSALWLPEGSSQTNTTKIRQLLRSAGPISARKPSLNSGLVGFSVDQKRPYRPQTRTSSRQPGLERSRTTFTTTPTGYRHCDACSVKDLQYWFQRHPTTSVHRSEISPLRKSDLIAREKSQVFLLNQSRQSTMVGNKMTEVVLPTATIPKKGLIKLTCLDEGHSMKKVNSETGRRGLSRREPLRFLIKNKHVLNQLKQGCSILYQKPAELANVVIPDINHLTTEDLRNHLLSTASYDYGRTAD